MTLALPKRERQILVVESFEELQQHEIGSLIEDPKSGHLYRVTSWRISLTEEGERLFAVIGKRVRGR